MWLSRNELCMCKKENTCMNSIFPVQWTQRTECLPAMKALQMTPIPPSPLPAWTWVLPGSWAEAEEQRKGQGTDPVTWLNSYLKQEKKKKYREQQQPSPSSLTAKRSVSTWLLLMYGVLHPHEFTGSWASNDSGASLCPNGASESHWYFQAALQPGRSPDEASDVWCSQEAGMTHPSLPRKKTSWAVRWVPGFAHNNILYHFPQEQQSNEKKTGIMNK